MTIAGIIAEYNPLHNGHAFLMKELKKKGADRIAVVMSGNFVQRGDAAVLSKWARTKQALRCGADLVLELPLPWAVSGAEHFALGGTAALTALGADVIGFGSECGDIALLEEARKALASPQLHSAMREKLQSGATFAATRQEAVSRLFGTKTALLLREPNNILGIEYLKAIESLNSGLKPVTIRRKGAAHDGAAADGENASSAEIRRKLLNGQDFSPGMPDYARKIAVSEMENGRAPASLQNVEKGILAVLRRMNRNDFARLPDISEGLENRIFTAVRKTGNLADLYEAVKSKRYTLARIRRILLSAFLGMDASCGKGIPPYLRILGIGRGGAEILQAAKQKATLPIIAKYSDRCALDNRAKNILDLESRATDLYALCMPKAAPCGLDSSSKVITL